MVGEKLKSVYGVANGYTANIIEEETNAKNVMGLLYVSIENKGLNALSVVVLAYVSITGGGTGALSVMGLAYACIRSIREIAGSVIPKVI